MSLRISDRAIKQDVINRRTKVELICFAVIILVATVFFLSDGSVEDLNWDDTQLLLTVSEDLTYAIPYEQITRLELVEQPDFGTCLSGTSTKRKLGGIWKNDQLGDYVLYAYPDAPCVIHIATAEEDYWIALDNTETTTAFYEAFEIMLKNANYIIP